MQEGIYFLIGIPSHQEIYRKFLLERSPLIRNPANHLSGLGVYGVKEEVKIEERDYQIFAYYSSAKAAQDETALYENVEVQQGKVLSYEKNEEKINESLSICGMFGFVTNVKELTAEGAIRHYRRRDGIEKLYEGMKNPLELYRLRTHTDTSTEGKFFLGFIAQIFWADMIRIMQWQTKKPAPTVKAVLNEMKKIQKVSYKAEEFRMWILQKQGSL